jgi:hypothetical protein
VFGNIDEIKAVDREHLLPHLRSSQQTQGPWISGFSLILRTWIREAQPAYLAYAKAFPMAMYLVRQELDRNVLFRQFIDYARDNKLSKKLPYEHFLKAPISRIERLLTLLRAVLKNSLDGPEKAQLEICIEELKNFVHECGEKVSEETKTIEMMSLRSKLVLRPGMEKVQLQLDNPDRELIFRGDLLRAGANRFTWLETHALLFDHYLVLAKSVVTRNSQVKSQREKYDVSRLVGHRTFTTNLSRFRKSMTDLLSQFP